MTDFREEAYILEGKATDHQTYKSVRFQKMKTREISTTRRSVMMPRSLKMRAMTRN